MHRAGTRVYRYDFGIALQLKEEDDDSIVTGFTIRPRSSVWETGMVLSNSIGTINRGYTGEIPADCLHSSGKLLGVTYRSLQTICDVVKKEIGNSAAKQ